MRWRQDLIAWLVAGMLCAALLAFAGAAGAVETNVVNLDPKAARVVLNDALLLYVDPTGALDMNDVAAPAMAQRFARPAGDPRNLGDNMMSAFVFAWRQLRFVRR